MDADVSSEEGAFSAKRRAQSQDTASLSIGDTQGCMTCDSHTPLTESVQDSTTSRHQLGSRRSEVLAPDQAAWSMGGSMPGVRRQSRMSRESAWSEVAVSAQDPGFPPLQEHVSQLEQQYCPTASPTRGNPRPRVDTLVTGAAHD